MSTSVPTVVAGFEIGACVIPFFTAMILTSKAVKSSTGPSHEGTKMRDYSGVFENDMIPVIINLTVVIAYFGSLMEDLNGDQDTGFFHTYRFGSYLLSCPLIVWDLVYSSGGVYRLSSAALTWIALVMALLADVTEAPARWGWFSIGCVFYLILVYVLYRLLRRAMKISASLSKPSASYGSHQGVRAMRSNRKFIILAVSILFVIWPMFPVLFLLEHLGYTSHDFSIIGFAILDVLAKSLHSYFVDRYKRGLLTRLCTMGFLTPDVLQKVDPNEDIEYQLIKLMKSSGGSHPVTPRRRRSSSPSRSFLNMGSAFEESSEQGDGHPMQVFQPLQPSPPHVQQRKGVQNTPTSMVLGAPQWPERGRNESQERQYESEPDSRRTRRPRAIEVSRSFLTIGTASPKELTADIVMDGNSVLEEW